MSWLLYIVLQWTLKYMYLFPSWFSLVRCSGVGLQDQMVVLCLVFWGISILFSTVVAPIYNPTNSVIEFLFLHTLSSTYICRLFDDDHSGWYKVVPHSAFDLHFSTNEWCWTFFHLFFWPSVCLLWRTVCLDLLPIFDGFFFLFLVLSCRRCL